MLSIRNRLLIGLLLTMIVSLAAMLWQTWRDARHELNALFDSQLQQNASIIMLWAQTEPRSSEHLSPEKFRTELEKLLPLMTDVYLDRAAMSEDGSPQRDAEQNQFHRELAFVIRFHAGAHATPLEMASDNAPAFVFEPLADGFVEREVVEQSVEHLWHAYTIADSGWTVTVAERDDKRQSIIAQIVFRQIGVMVFILPLATILVWGVVGRGLAPLGRLGAQIRARKEDLLEPIDSQTPVEVRSLVDAINHLFERLSHAFERERQFSADAAHELRTPLATLRARAEVARTDHPECARSLDDIIKQADRARRVLDQLLLLARLDGEHNRMQTIDLDLVTLCREVLADRATLAMRHQVELELIHQQPQIRISGEPISLSILLNNLLDNAIAHSPDGGLVSVDLKKDLGTTQLRVRDQGPGIPASLRRSVIDRFNRGPHQGSTVDQTGTGLGLTIAQRIVDLHGAALQFDDRPSGKGLEVVVTFSA